jgi:hypothetical protein
MDCRHNNDLNRLPTSEHHSKLMAPSYENANQHWGHSCLADPLGHPSAHASFQNLALQSLSYATPKHTPTAYNNRTNNTQANNITTRTESTGAQTKHGAVDFRRVNHNN